MGVAISVPAPTGTCTTSATAVDCTLGTLPSGGNATITIIVRPTAAGILTNSATVTATTQDPNAANNTGTAGTLVSAPAPPPPPGQNCHASYPTVCIPPAPPDLDCGQISHRNFTVRHDVPDPDPHRFDSDRDGVGCES